MKKLRGMEKKNFLVLIILAILFPLFFYSCFTKKKSSLSETVDKNQIQIPVKDPEFVYNIDSSYMISKAEIINGILNLKIRYIGGCGTHNFDLMWNGRYLKSYPLQISLFVRHTSENEKCTKYKFADLSYNLSTIMPPEEDTVFVNLAAFGKKLIFIKNK